MRRYAHIPQDPQAYINPKTDMKNHRIWVTKFNKVHFIKEGPFGHWKVHLDKGQLKQSLKGSWTSFEDAAKAVELYYLTPMKEEIREKIY